jgi:hypothetical protein
VAGASGALHLALNLELVSPRAGFVAIDLGLQAVDLEPCPLEGCSRALQRVVASAQNRPGPRNEMIVELAVAFVGCSLAIVSQPLAHVRDLLTLVRDPLTLIGQSVPLVGDPVTLVSSALALVKRCATSFVASGRPCCTRRGPRALRRAGHHLRLMAPARAATRNSTFSWPRAMMPGMGMSSLPLGFPTC